MPRIRVLAGASPETLKPIKANQAQSHKIKTPGFEGEIAVFLKDFTNEHGETVKADYFDHPERKGQTWSIQCRGRFLKTLSVDDILFGNVFDRALTLPYGSGAALQFMKLQDPTLEYELQGDRPWALSPLISTTPIISHEEHSPDEPLPTFSTAPLVENPKGLVPDGQNRHTYFGSREHRQAVKLGPSNVIQADFVHGFLSFNQGLALSLPIGMSFDLMKYWDGRPIWYVCCERNKDGKGPGEPFWSVGFEIVEDEDEGDEEDAEGEDDQEYVDAHATPAPKDISGDID